MSGRLRQLERWIPFGVALVLLGAALACTSGEQAYRGYDLGNQVQYTCPTKTAVPTWTPTYPGYLSVTPWMTVVNTSGFFPVFDFMTVLAQNAGNVYANVWFYPTFGSPVPWMTNVFLGNAPGYPPGGYFPFNSLLLIGSNMSGYFQITISSDTAGSVSAIVSVDPSYLTNGIFMPCYSCVPPAFVPTPIPTLTPVVMHNDFFLNDWVVIDDNGLKVGIRITWQDPSNVDAPSLPDGIPTTRLNMKVVPPQPQWIYVYKVEVTDVGAVRYSVFPFLQSYIAEMVDVGTDPITQGKIGDLVDVWGPSGEAVAEVMPSHFSDTWGSTLEPYNQNIPPGVLTPSYMRSRELGTCVGGLFGWGYDVATGRWYCYRFNKDGDLGLAPNPKLIPTMQDAARGPYGYLTDRFVMAAYGPVNKKIWKVGFALDMRQRPTPGGSLGGVTTPAPTGVPGNNVAFWLNHVNTDLSCTRPYVVP